MSDTEDMSRIMAAELNWAQLKYMWAVPEADETFSNEELKQLCRVPCRVDIWRSNLCFKYFYIYSREWYQCDMNDLEEHQKDVITKCMLKDWKPFEDKFMDHDRYLRRQRSRRDERNDKFIDARHERRWRKKMRLLANVPDSQASLFVPHINETESLDSILYEPSTQDFVLPENQPQTYVEDLPQIDPEQQPKDDDYTDNDDETEPDVEIVYNIQEGSLSSEEESFRTVILSSESVGNASCETGRHIGDRFIINSSSERMTSFVNGQDQDQNENQPIDWGQSEDGVFSEIVTSTDTDDGSQGAVGGGDLADLESQGTSYNAFASGENKVASTQELHKPSHSTTRS